MKLNNEELIELFDTTNQERLDGFVNILSEEKTLWGLSNEQGWLMMEQEQKALLPLWPQKEIAEYWTSEQPQTYEATAISWSDWQETWVPGLIKNEVKIIVCPNLGEDHICLDADEFSQMLQ